MAPNLQASVLCAIDLAGSSRHTLKWSVEMAQRLNAKLTILYTYRLLQSTGKNGLAIKEIREREAKEEFQKLETELLNGVNLNYHFCVEIGFVSDRVADFAKRNQLSMLIIDKNTCADNHESFDELISHLQVPALVVP